MLLRLRQTSAEFIEQRLELRWIIAAIKAGKPETFLNKEAECDLDRDDVSEIHTITILHVEDDEIVAGIVKETLESQGWEVDACSDGNAALEKISSETDYDLLLIDYDLPGVNGLEIVGRARNLTHRSRTPIVMFSARPVEAAAHEAGANVFLQKPGDVGSLIQTITPLLEKHEQEE